MLLNHETYCALPLEIARTSQLARSGKDGHAQTPIDASLSKMSDGRDASLETDFEDLLESFENKFAKTLASRAPPPHALERRSSLVPVSENVFDPKDFPEELSLLLSQVHELALSKRRTRDADDGEPVEQWNTSIGREVMRGEIRDAISRLKLLDEHAVDSAEANPSQKTTIMSLKRRHREMEEELHQARKQKKATEVKLRGIEEMQDTYQSKVRMVEDKALLLQTERGEQDIKIRELEGQNSHLAADKKRLEKNVAMLRTEVLASHHKVSEQKLETTQAERRVADLEARAAEMRSSEAALTERVKELHEVQGQMLEEMKKVVDSKDAPAARRALNTLTQQRSRIVGKIASILTKRNSTVGRQYSGSEHSASAAVDATIDASQAQISQSYPDLRIDTDPARAGSSSTPKLAEVASSSTHSIARLSGIPRQNSSDGGGIQRKSSLMGIFRVGSQSPASGGGVGLGRQRSNERSSVVPSPRSSKQSRQQIYESNLLRSRDAAERDSDAMREVVDNKAAEIGRLETELQEAKQSAATLERELHEERQHRRKENRNLHITAEDEPRKHLSAVVQQRNKPSTLFEWQGSASRQGSKDEAAAGAGTRKSAGG